jgi:hypothetical protein
MPSAADNEPLTRTGRDAPIGELFRRFWIPALEPAAARNAAGYTVRSGRAPADRSVPLADVMRRRFGGAVGRVGEASAAAQASSAT